MEAKTNLATLQHITNVRNNLNKVITELIKRGELHDQTKMEEPELPVFDKFTSKLSECSYGSKTYKKHLEEMHKHEGVFWDHMDEEDEIRGKLQKIQEQLDKITKPCFEEPMKYYDFFTTKIKPWANKTFQRTR